MIESKLKLRDAIERDQHKGQLSIKHCQIVINMFPLFIKFNSKKCEGKVL